jgi:hypothetical protein
VQRGSIVDAVAQESYNVAEPFQGKQNPKLLLRVDPTG